MTAQSTSAGGYRIADEPTPGGLAGWAVNPLWPLLALMLGGAWLSWPWFVLNAFAVGSPTRRRETLWAVGGFVGTALLLLALSVLLGAVEAARPFAEYLVVFLFVWKALVSYRLFLMQSRTFELFTYFGGTARNGMPVVFLAFFVRPRVLEALPAVLRMIVS